MPLVNMEILLLVLIGLYLIAVSNFETIKLQKPVLKGIWTSVWNRGIRRAWYRLWIRRDEFHASFNYDHEAMSRMSPKRREKYIRNMESRRQTAHERDLKSSEQT